MLTIGGKDIYMRNLFFLLSFLTAASAFLFALYLYLWVKRQRIENEEISEDSFRKLTDEELAEEQDEAEGFDMTM